MASAPVGLLADLHNILQTSISTFAKDIGSGQWGWPGGGVDLPHTYMIPTPRGPLLLGPDDGYENRWWLAVALVDSIPSTSIDIGFEFNIPKSEPITTLSFEYEHLGGRTVQARHKGWVTVGQRVAAENFFDHYNSEPGPWPVIPTERGDRLGLFTFDLDHMAYPQFYAFACTLAEFADYVTWYKDSIREERT